MTRRALLASAAAVAAIAGVLYLRPARTVAAAPTLPESEAAAVRKVVVPAPGEDVFADIPWRTSVWDAREAAAKEGKPILLWEMDGHPLGCG